MITYCVRCKSKTDSVQPSVEQTKNNRFRLKTKCVVCGTQKSTLISKQKLAQLQEGGFLPILAGLAAAPLVSGLVGKLTGNGAKFKKKAKGGSLNSIINSLPTEAHLVDFGVKGLKPYVRRYNFCGPGTKLDKRLGPDDKPHDWSKPINGLDQACYHHDLAYRDHRDVPARNVADQILLDRANQWEKQMGNQLSTADKANLGIVRNVMKAKVKFGLGK